MNLLIVGINHNSAPVELREKVAFTPEQLDDALKDISERASFAEVAILSTCNRTEIMATGKNLDQADITAWLSEYHKLPAAALEPAIYQHRDREAARHAMRVACGLDSMVVGEPQILGQFKDSFDRARQYGTLGRELDHLAQTTFRIAKKVRTETAIGESSVSIASTAVTLAEQLFSELASCQILLIGAGDTTALVGKHLQSAGITQITIANRTLDNARRLAEELGGSAIDLQSIPNRLQDMDIVIASTAAQLPILGKGTVERALKERKHRPILMVDLAVPRDIEPEVGELRDIYLYSVDDLQEIINNNLSSRQEAAQKAEAIVEEEMSQYRSRQEVQSTDETLIRFRQLHNDIRDEELDKALARLEKGENPANVVRQLANQLTNKMIHKPSVELKAASVEGDGKTVDVINKLYLMDQDE